MAEHGLTPAEAPRLSAYTGDVRRLRDYQRYEQRAMWHLAYALHHLEQVESTLSILGWRRRPNPYVAACRRAQRLLRLLQGLREQVDDVQRADRAEIGEEAGV